MLLTKPPTTLATTMLLSNNVPPTSFLSLPSSIHAAILSKCSTADVQHTLQTCRELRYEESLYALLPPTVQVHLHKSPEDLLPDPFYYPSAAPKLKKLTLCGHQHDLTEPTGPASSMQLIGFLSSCKVCPRAGSLLGGVEELVLQGWGTLGRAPDGCDPLADLLCSLFGSLRVLSLEDGTVLDPDFYALLRTSSCGQQQRPPPPPPRQGAQPQKGTALVGDLGRHELGRPPASAPSLGGLHALHTLKLPSRRCLCFEWHVEAIAGLAGLKWLQLGQGGVRSRHASFDLSPLSRLTGLEHLQFACDSQQDGWGAVLSSCSRLTHLEVNHGCEFLLHDMGRGRSTSLQSLTFTHSLALTCLPLLAAAAPSLCRLRLLDKATWASFRKSVRPGLTDAAAAAAQHWLSRLEEVTWDPPPGVGLVVDALNAGMVLPCAQPLALLLPLMAGTPLAQALRTLQLESVSFEAGEVGRLAVLFPNVQALILEDCMLTHCWAVHEAMSSWVGLGTLVLRGTGTEMAGGDSAGRGLSAMAALLRARNHRQRPLRIELHRRHEGSGASLLDDLPELQAALGDCAEIIIQTDCCGV